MADKKAITKVRRDKRRYRPFESKKSRERNSCPVCGSVNVRKRRETYDYICYRCGWKGNAVIKIEY